MKGKRILGIDPGFRVSGYALIESDGNVHRHIDSGVIDVTKLELPQRLGAIFDAVSEVIADCKPDAVSVEGVFMSKNARSALVLGQARGVAICAAVKTDLPLHEYSAKSIKKSVTGSGSADKNQVRYMVCRLLQIAERDYRDETDAMAIALCHSFHMASPLFAEAKR